MPCSGSCHCFGRVCVFPSLPSNCTVPQGVPPEAPQASQNCNQRTADLTCRSATEASLGSVPCLSHHGNHRSGGHVLKQLLVEGFFVQLVVVFCQDPFAGLQRRGVPLVNTAAPTRHQPPHCLKSASGAQFTSPLFKHSGCLLVRMLWLPSGGSFVPEFSPLE